MKKKRKISGRKLLSYLLTLVMILGLMPGMSLTAYAENYTSLTDGQILHVGDTFTPEGDYYNIAGYVGWRLDKRVAPFKLVRVNLIIPELPWEEATIVESDEGQYYCFYVSGWEGCNCVYDSEHGISGLGYIVFETTATSDGLTVTREGNTVSFAVHEGTSVAVTGVTLNPSTAQTIDVNGKVSFTATIAPDDATDKKVKWSVGGTNAGAVKLYIDEACTTEVGEDATDKLTVYAKGESAGSANVIVTTNDGDKTASCAVTVDKANPTASDFIFNAPENLSYDGTDKTATVVPGSGVTGMGAVTVKYYSDAACTDEVENPTNAGTYYVGITVTEGDNYSATASVLHGSNWQFTIGKETPTVDDFNYNAPSNLGYDGTAKSATVIASMDATGMGAVTVKYYSDAACTDEVENPTNAGTYYVGITVTEGDNYSASTDVLHGDNWTFVVTQADSTVTAPTANTLTYNGQEQAFVSGGASEDGEMQYALGTATEATQPYTTSIPTATEAGTYYVWYKVVGDENHNDSTTSYVPVEIGKATLTITAIDQSCTYNGEIQGEGDTVYEDPSEIAEKVDISGLIQGEAIASVQLDGQGMEAGGYPISVGSASVKKGETDVTANYNISYMPGTLTINKAQTGFTVSLEDDSYVYDGLEKANTKTAASTAAGGTTTFSYSFEENGTYVSDLSDLKKIDAGSYTIYVQATNPNYLNTATTTAKLTIAQKDITITAGSSTKNYDGTELTYDSYNVSELANGDALDSVTVTGSQTDVGSSDNVASAAVIKKGETDVTANYNINYVKGTLTVNKETRNNVSVSITGWTYGEEADEPEASTDFGTPVITYSDSADGTFTDEVPLDAGTWYIKAAVPDTANYAGGEAVVSFVISQKAITITADSDTKVYDGTALSKDSFTNTDTAEGDEIDSVTITGEQTDAGSIDNVPSAAVIKKGDADITANYDITYVNGTLTVTQAANSANVSIDDWAYGDEAAEPSCTADFGADKAVFTYSDAEDGTFTDTVPGTVGTWYVKATIAETDNYAGCEAVAGFKITPFDKSALKTAIEDAEKFLETIDKEHKDVAEKLQKAIDEAKAAYDDDNKTEAEIADAVKAQNEALEAAKQAIYVIESGADGTYTKESGKDIVITVKSLDDPESSFDRFDSVEIAGKVLVKGTDYTAEKGSTVITIKASYLDTLEEGKKDVVIKFTNGEAKTSLTIEKAPEKDKPADQGGKDSSSPKTADSFDPRMLLIMLGASILGLAVCIGKKKENR